MRNIFKMNRRHFLIGAGGFALTVPLLPSLLRDDRAYAQARTPKRFVALVSSHGGVWESNMYPVLSTEEHELAPNHVMRHADLRSAIDGGDRALAPSLRAPEAEFPEALVAKMNVVRGLSIMHYIGHHHGGHLGNYNSSDQLEGRPLRARATIDQVMAYSGSFYTPAELSGIARRSIYIGGSGHSFMWADPSSPGGAVEVIEGDTRPRSLFDAIIPRSSGEPEPVPRRAVVDRVLEHYRGLTSGRFGDAQRLSPADRRRLEQYMQRLSEVERGVSLPHRDCGDAMEPPDLGGLGYGPVDVDAQELWYRTMNDIIAAAFMCDVTRIAVINCTRPFATGSNDESWHDSIAHQSHNRDGIAQGQMVESQRNVFRVLVDLARKLDFEEADGRTFLDNSLLQWTQESGLTTHVAIDMPVITFGSAGGFFQTGRFFDYRNFANDEFPNPPGWGNPLDDGSGGLRDYIGTCRTGLTYNQWLATALQSMGLTAGEYQLDGDMGYGQDFTDNPAALLPHMRSMANEVLPLMRA